MKLATFTHEGSTRVGAVVDGGILDLKDDDLPGDMLSLLQRGDGALDTARALVAQGGDTIPLEAVTLHQPVLRPGKILAIGLNYADHIAETGGDAPKVQLWFNKQSTASNGPFDPVALPVASHMLDYEGELALVIGKRCRHVPAERALEVIAGFMVINDVSVRDWQARSPTFQMGKSFDTHAPMGPWMVTTDEIGDPHNLDIKTWVNGELRQDSNTKHLIFNINQQIEHLTTAFTLEPGDVIATGTSSGVAAAMKPPKWLVEGDQVKIEVEKIGAIECSIVRESGETVID